jgi:hypothetical protein
MGRKWGTWQGSLAPQEAQGCISKSVGPSGTGIVAIG